MAPLLPGQPDQWGGIAEDNRKYINAVFWVLGNGVPWRDLPGEYGKWGTVYQRFTRWRTKGIWEKILEILVDEPGYEWLIGNIDQIAAHCHGAGKSRGGQSVSQLANRRKPGYIWPWLRLICRSELLLSKVPQKVLHLYARSIQNGTTVAK